MSPRIAALHRAVSNRYTRRLPGAGADMDRLLQEAEEPKEISPRTDRRGAAERTGRKDRHHLSRRAGRRQLHAASGSGARSIPSSPAIVVLEDVFRFSTRKTSPLAISGKDTRRLLATLPFWAFRFVSFLAYRNPVKKIRFILNQLRAHFYIINESGGISHIAPDYEKLIAVGTDGIKQEAAAHQARVPKKSEAWHFYEGVRIVCDALAEFGLRYAVLAARDGRDRD